MTPHSVSLTKNLKASNTVSVPSQMNLQRRGSIVVPNSLAYESRIGELIPSHTSTRSWDAMSSSTGGASVRNRMFTPWSIARRWSTWSSSLRLIAAKPLPPIVIISPFTVMSMSSQ